MFFKYIKQLIQYIQKTKHTGTVYTYITYDILVAKMLHKETTPRCQEIPCTSYNNWDPL